MGRAPRPQPQRLPAKLAEVRKRLDLTQGQMVKRLGKAGERVKPGHISEFESGTREPSLLVLLQYSKVAGVTVNHLIDDQMDLPKRLPAEPEEWIMVRRKP